MVSDDEELKCVCDNGKVFILTIIVILVVLLCGSCCLFAIRMRRAHRQLHLEVSVRFVLLEYWLWTSSFFISCRMNDL